jgi:hypothetical protein
VLLDLLQVGPLGLLDLPECREHALRAGGHAAVVGRGAAGMGGCRGLRAGGGRRGPSPRRRRRCLQQGQAAAAAAAAKAAPARRRCRPGQGRAVQCGAGPCAWREGRPTCRPWWVRYRPETWASGAAGTLTLTTQPGRAARQPSVAGRRPSAA